MSSDKEFFTDWVGEVTETSGDLGAYFSIESATEMAWNHQQSKLDAKDELLRECLKEIVNAASWNYTRGQAEKFLNKPEIKALRGDK